MKVWPSKEPRDTADLSYRCLNVRDDVSGSGDSSASLSDRKMNNRNIIT